MDTDNYIDLQKKHVNYALHGKEMLCTSIVLFIVLLIILFFHNYVRIIFSDRHRRYFRRRARQLLSISTAGTTRPTFSSKGLKPSVLKTIPTVIYSTKAAHFPPFECAVCLSEFENGEKTRVLPKCNHTFHVDCIDMWFYSHSNCPLCRAPVHADIPVNPAKPLEQTAVPVAEAAGPEPPRDDIEMNSSSATASSSTSSSSSSLSSPSSLNLESCPMKTLELVGVELEIHVEVPNEGDR